jgi:hypothetical protein
LSLHRAPGFVSVLEIDAAISPFFSDQKFNVGPKVSELLLRYDVGRAIHSARRSRIITRYRGTLVDRIFHNFPLDRRCSSKARTLPVRPVFIEHLAGAIEKHDRVFGRLDTNTHTDVVLGAQFSGRTHTQNDNNVEKHSTSQSLHLSIPRLNLM